MRIAYFTQSLASCWNHGNAHFLRGVLRELMRRGHTVQAFEPRDSWSMVNMLADTGPGGGDAWRAHYPELRSVAYTKLPKFDADLVLVHEWNEPELVAALGNARKQGARYKLWFHDTHHRAVSDPELQRYDLTGYDGVLAFGATLAEVYRSWGWGDRVHVWHEAADIRHFKPSFHDQSRQGAVWIGNWGDGERTAEIEEFLLAPAHEIAVPLDIYGVRYPEEALHLLKHYGAHYRGWLPNARVPYVFARHEFTVHVPRSFYTTLLPGIPTIRVFEALACGIPLISAPWQDSEGLFTPGEDFLVAHDRAEMVAHITRLRSDPALRQSLIAHGMATIHARHTCAHRVNELMKIIGFEK